MTTIDEHSNGEGAAVLQRLRELPGGRELLDLAAQHGGSVELVGGAVRDILLGRAPRELDVVVEADPLAFAQALSPRLASDEHGCEVIHHERFHTALVRWSEGEIDIAMRRHESYSEPGALPDVAQGTQEQDLARRDFTVNAIAVTLAGERAGRLVAAAGALEDLSARRLRVLHDASFIDDPTRILRPPPPAAR